MTVAQLQAGMSSREFTEWMAFDSIEPFGEPRADLRMGILAACSVNHSMAPPKSPARPMDFMPFADHQAPEPVKLADADAHARLVAKTLFGEGVAGGIK